MAIYLVAIGTRLPTWINQGFEEYCKRLPPHFKPQLIEVESLKNGKNRSPDWLIQEETRRIEKNIPSKSLVIAVDRSGKSMDTEQFTTNLRAWFDDGQSPCFIVGGAHGLTRSFVKQAPVKFALSDLTFPHGLVRILLAEQIYRAFSVLTNHPYHK